MTVDLAAVRLTRQKVNTGIWLCAALTMAASAISGVTAFYYLQKDGWGIASGAMTALAVDVALWVVLTGDRLMEALGITAGPWARAVRWGTAIMSITLNITAAAVADIPGALKAPTRLVAAQSRAQTVPAGRATPVRDAAFRWLDNHHGPSTTANTLAAAIDASPHTCKKLLGEWRKQKQEVAS
jgi:hypothetical protein